MFLNAFFKKFKKADIDFEWRNDVEKLSILSLILKSKDQELLDAQEKNFSLACRFREYITKRPDEEQEDADSKFQKFFEKEKDAICALIHKDHAEERDPTYNFITQHKKIIINF